MRIKDQVIEHFEEMIYYEEDTLACESDPELIKDAKQSIKHLKKLKAWVERQ